MAACVKLPQAKATSGKAAKSAGVQGGDALRTVVAAEHIQQEVSSREQALPPSPPSSCRPRGLQGGFWSLLSF